MHIRNRRRHEGIITMKSYTIVYFMDYGKALGGAGMTMLRQMTLMKKLGHRVVVFFSDYYGREMCNECMAICLQAGIRYEWGAYQISSQPEDIDLIYIGEKYEALRNKVAVYQPDILHSVQLNPCAELIGRELNVPHIMDIYQLAPEFFSIKYLNIFAHYHICDSLYYAKRWEQYFNTDSVCIRTAADENIVREKRFGEKNDYICVGGIYERKNQLTVIEAFHKALMHGVRGKLFLCGYADGEYCDKCRQYVRDNGLENKIIFRGFCTDMSVEYANSNILICGSICESYPNAVSEAMANGLLVISTPVAGVPELIVDGENGYLARNYSADALCEKIIEASEDIANGRIEAVRDNSRNTFRKHHLPQIVSGQLVQYYQYVLKDYRKWKDQKSDRITIDGLNLVFQKIVERFKNYEPEFTYPQEVSNKLWYLYHISDIVNDANERGKDFYIWGTGKFGIVVKEMLEVFLPQIPVRGVIDSRKSGKFYEYTIYNPDEIVPDRNTVIFIAAMNGQSEMIREIESVGKRFNKDYFILSRRVW